MDNASINLPKTWDLTSNLESLFYNALSKTCYNTTLKIEGKKKMCLVGVLDYLSSSSADLEVFSGRKLQNLKVFFDSISATRIMMVVNCLRDIIHSRNLFCFCLARLRNNNASICRLTDWHLLAGIQIRVVQVILYYSTELNTRCKRFQLLV